MTGRLHGESPYEGLRRELAADCGRCRGLCCGALCFSKGAGFPDEKPAGVPCRHLLPDFRCALHESPAYRALRGCMAYDCLGAGPRTTALFGGRERALSPKETGRMYAVYLTVRRLCQMEWYLVEAASLLPARELLPEAGALIEGLERPVAGPPEALDRLDPEGLYPRVDGVLRRAWALCRAAVGAPPEERGGGDLCGRRFRGEALCGRDLSGALLLAAKLRGCRLWGTNFLGADLRDADLSGADLRESVFLTQGQLAAAKGDRSTLLPAWARYPMTWTDAS